MIEYNLQELKNAWKTIKECSNPKTLNFKEYDKKKSFISNHDKLTCLMNNDKIVFVFQETNELKDWFGKDGNTNISKTCVNNILRFNIASGFYNASNNFKGIVETQIELYGDNKDILFFGYSRGAAISTEIQRHITDVLRKKTKCIVFGSPRVGNYNYAYYMKAHPLITHISVYFEKDIVTKSPPENLGFYHIDDEIFKMKRKWWHNLPLPLIKLKIHKSYDDILKYKV